MPDQYTAFPVRALIEAADPNLNLELEGGEEIPALEKGEVFVLDNVHKPGAFTVGEASETTVLKMPTSCGDLMLFTTKRAYIYRTDRDCRLWWMTSYVRDNTGSRSTMMAIGRRSRLRTATNDAEQLLATQVRLIGSDPVRRPVSQKYWLLDLEGGDAANDTAGRCPGRAEKRWCR